MLRFDDLKDVSIDLGYFAIPLFLNFIFLSSKCVLSVKIDNQVKNQCIKPGYQKFEIIVKLSELVRESERAYR